MSRKKRKIISASVVGGIGQAETRYYPGTNIKTTDPFAVMKCPLCGWTCWSIRGEPIPCQQCGGTMEKEKTGA